MLQCWEHKVARIPDQVVRIWNLASVAPGCRRGDLDLHHPSPAKHPDPCGCQCDVPMSSRLQPRKGMERANARVQAAKQARK